MRKYKRVAIIAVVGLALVAGAAHFLYRSWMYVSTDDAQVGAHVTMLSSRVSGTIAQVFADENQPVKAGEVLAQIDTSDYTNASAVAEAQVAQLQARFREAELNFHRMRDLYSKQAVPKQRFDDAQAAYRELEAKIKAAQAQREQANLNVSYTRIVAPGPGVIARRSAEVGQFVPAGQPLFGFVASEERWVIANLKETDLARVRVGQPVSISIDAIPGHDFRGRVVSIGPATGAVFSLLPPDNATGNFTKVVQRVPVRVAFVGLSSDEVTRLHAGLSVDVSIRVR